MKQGEVQVTRRGGGGNIDEPLGGEVTGAGRGGCKLCEGGLTGGEGGVRPVREAAANSGKFRGDGLAEEEGGDVGTANRIDVLVNGIKVGKKSRERFARRLGVRGSGAKKRGKVTFP